MIIRGGENVYPREVEEVLYAHPAIVETEVIGVPDAHVGEELMAWVILREGRPHTEDDVPSTVGARLATFKSAA